MLDFEPCVYERLFRSLDNNAVIMRVEDNGKYYPVWCSREFTEMMGCSEEEFIRLESGGTMDTIHPDYRSEVSYLFRNHITESGTNSLTISKKTSSGKYIWVCVHYSFFEDKGTQYAYCTYFDVTDLKESQDMTRAMYNGLNEELNSLADESLAALRINLTAEKVEEVRGFDLYDTDVQGADLRSLIKVRMENMPIEADRVRYSELFSRERLTRMYYTGEGSASLVIFSKRRSGMQCFIKYSASTRKDPVTGDIILLMVETEYNSQKVTEVLDQKVLAEQYDMVCYVVGDNYGVTIGDPKLIKKGSIFPEKRDGSYTGYLRSQVLPAACGQVHDREELYRALCPETLEQRLSENEPYIVDMTCEINGDFCFKRFTFYTVDRSANFYILLKSDMTDIIKVQREQNELLRNALEEANKANAAKTAFLSSMSHAIRTPMNAIIGLDNIALKDEELSVQTREYLEKIGGSAHHLLRLINDILDMSRIESGRMTIRNEEFPFSEMLEQINTMINSQCRSRGLHYECRILGRTDPYYIGDVMKLKQVLINILGNAVKFTHAPGTVSLTVEKTVCFEDRSTLRFVMKDTGIGMDKEFLPKLFDAFSQENENAANKFGSTGLGMAITRNIVEMMNGSISVTSEKGAGSEFTVNITLKNSSRERERPGCLIRPEDMHVLVTDDDPVACEHARLVLEELGISADICTSGEQAVEAVRLRHARLEEYNLILLDLKMPEMDGIETARRIREVTGGGQAVMILTAYSWNDIEEEAAAAGIDGFIAKPLFADKVTEEINKALSSRSARKTEEIRRADLNGRRILLAEDVDINAEIMKELLDMRGMTAEHGENGKIVSEMFAASPPGYYDAVLMDVRMPVMNGLEAAAAIRALDRPDARTVPIIAMTANAFDEDVQQTMQAGMNAHLSKPVEPDHLYDTLEKLINC